MEAVKGKAKKGGFKVTVNVLFWLLHRYYLRTYTVLHIQKIQGLLISDHYSIYS